MSQNIGNAGPSGSFARLLGFVLMAAAIAVVFQFLSGLSKIAPPILRADYLYLLFRLDRIMLTEGWSGAVAFVTENQAGHTFIPYKIFMILNYGVFGWNTFLVKILDLSIFVISFCVLAGVIVQRWHRSPVTTGFALLGTASLLMSYNGFSAAIWTDAALVIYPPVALSLLALCLLHSALQDDNQRWGALMGAAFVSALTLVWHGGGVALLPAMGLLAVLHAAQHKAPIPSILRRSLFVGTLAICPLLLAPILSGFSTTGTDVSSEGLAFAVANLQDCLRMFLALLTWPIQQERQDLAVVTGAVALSIYAVLVLACLFRLVDRHILLWLAYAGFGIGGAAAIAVTRTYYFTQVIKAVPSNYAVYTLPFLIGLFLALILCGAEWLRRGVGTGQIASGFAALSALMIVGYPLAVRSGYAFDENRSRALLDVELMQDSFRLTQNWNPMYAVRLVGGDPVFALTFLFDVLPSWSERGILPALSKDLVTVGKGFEGASNIGLLNATMVPKSKRQMCNPIYGTGMILDAKRDTRLDMVDRLPDRHFVRLIGVSYVPRCERPVDRVLLTDENGEILCASITFPRQVDLPEVFVSPLNGYPDAFDFTCPIPVETFRAGRWKVYGWREADRSLFDADLSPDVLSYLRELNRD